jgi:NAD(P)-dependent dehydrogenase (short-subunit alcohol dehydrogenase family)
MANILITGCSSGFGLAATLAFARRGDRVYATARSTRQCVELEQLAASEGLDIHPRLLDVCRSETFADFVTALVTEAGHIDVLVNNAGILRPGAWEDLPESAIREVMETNFFGAMLLTRALLPHMRDRGGGYIINISSLSGIAGLAGDVAYSASKFALEGATEALRHEVDRWGIRVALVEAAQYATRIFRDAEEPPPEHTLHSPYRALVEQKLEATRASLDQALPASDIGELLLRIADSDGSRLRWPADDLSRRVLDTLHGQDDAERDAFLRMAGDSDWWSNGDPHPPAATDSGS